MKTIKLHLTRCLLLFPRPVRMIWRRSLACWKRPPSLRRSWSLLQSHTRTEVKEIDQRMRRQQSRRKFQELLLSQNNNYSFIVISIIHNALIHDCGLRFHVFIHQTNYEELPGKEYSELNWRGKNSSEFSFENVRLILI